MRPTDQELNTIGKIPCGAHRAAEEGAHGVAPGQSGGRGVRGKCGREPLLWFLREGMGEAGHSQPEDELV